MKKTTLFFLAFTLVFAFGPFAQAQEQTPPPAKPAAATVPPAAVKPVAATPAALVPVTAEAAEAPVAEQPAQSVPPTQATAPAPVAAQTSQAATASPKPEKPPVLRTELIKLKYADGLTIQSLLYSYRSQWGKVTWASGSQQRQGGGQSIVVIDTPEIIEKMLAVVREIDIKPAEIQFTVQLIQGTDTEEKGDEALKNDPIIRELRNVLRYKSFSLLDGTVMRVIDGEQAEAKIGPKGEYSIRLNPKYTKDGASETIQTRIELRKPQWISQQTTNTEKKEETRSMQMYYNDLVSTMLLLKAGEKTVVGVSKSDADSGLILILSAKVIK